jgi:hypothetical protein
MLEHRHAVIIGGQRCGSTLLARLLAHHPSVELARPERPEPKFFLRSSDHDEYHRLHFPEDAHLLLEKSTTYLERPDSERRMREIPGGVRPIVILRDPVARAISNWRFSRESGLEDLPADLALSEAGELRPFPETMSTSPYHYLRRSKYSALLEPWIQSNGGDEMSFLVFESLIAEPENEMRRLQTELRLELRSPPGLGPVNESREVETIEDDVLAALREKLRPEAEAMVKYLPEIEALWPTLA